MRSRIFLSKSGGSRLNGILSYKSHGSRRERDFFFQNLKFREGNENYKMKSHGRARKNEANSRENSRDREFSLVSGHKSRAQ